MLHTKSKGIFLLIYSHKHEKLHICVTVLIEPGELSGIALGFGLDDWWFESWQGVEIFFFTTASRPALMPTQPPTQWVRGTLSLGVKLPGRKPDHSLPSSAEVKNAWSYTFTPPICLYGVVLSQESTWQIYVYLYLCNE
jgi:hypothetical protein